jgi:predicted small metal-binding protein
MFAGKALRCIAGKALRCDCGFEVRACDDKAFVEAIRRHAWEAHSIDFAVELALDVARSARGAPSGGAMTSLKTRTLTGSAAA